MKGWGFIVKWEGKLENWLLLGAPHLVSSYWWIINRVRTWRWEYHVNFPIFGEVILGSALVCFVVLRKGFHGRGAGNESACTGTWLWNSVVRCGHVDLRRFPRNSNRALRWDGFTPTGSFSVSSQFPVCGGNRMGFKKGRHPEVEEHLDFYRLLLFLFLPFSSFAFHIFH